LAWSSGHHPHPVTHQPHYIQWRWTDSKTVIELGELSH
jgi:hypothetical protein